MIVGYNTSNTGYYTAWHNMPCSIARIRYFQRNFYKKV